MQIYSRNFHIPIIYIQIRILLVKYYFWHVVNYQVAKTPRESKPCSAKYPVFLNKVLISTFTLKLINITKVTYNHKIINSPNKT